MALKNEKAVSAEVEVETVRVMDTKVPAEIRILNGSLEESDADPVGMILTGAIDPASLRFLKVDLADKGGYQRPLDNRPEIYQAYVDGAIPPAVDLGVRGDLVRTEGKHNYVISSPTYIIDGWQRVGTALRYLEDNPDHGVRLYAMVHFGTNDKWERHRFTMLNNGVRKVSPNLKLRNLRDQNDVVLSLYGLTHNTQSFALYNRVSWGQRMKRGELLTALLLLTISHRLHMHVTEGVAFKRGEVGRGGGRSKSGVTGDSGLLAHRAFLLSKQIGLNNYRTNTQSFFDVIEECWGIRNIEVAASAPQIKGPFLDMLAKLFDLHTDFWQGNKLLVTNPQIAKLKKFNLQDPYIRSLTGGHGSSKNILYQLLVDHYNSGRRTGHLTQRYSK